MCRATSGQLSRGSEVQLTRLCKSTCLQKMLKRALPTCLQSVAPIKIKAADLKPTDNFKSEVCSRRSRYWAPRKVCGRPSPMARLFMARVQRVGSTSSRPTPSSSAIEKLKMLETASPDIKLAEADMLSTTTTSSPTEGARVVRVVAIKNQFCSGTLKTATPV